MSESNLSVQQFLLDALYQARERLSTNDAPREGFSTEEVSSLTDRLQVDPQVFLADASLLEKAVAVFESLGMNDATSGLKNRVRNLALLSPTTEAPKITAQKLKVISVSGADYSIVLASSAITLNHEFQNLFGPNVEIQDLIAIFESQNTGLVLESLSIEKSMEGIVLNVTFHNGLTSIKGNYACLFTQNSNGTLVKSGKANLQMGGHGQGIGIQIQANLAAFCKKAAIVTDFWIEAREGGRYAYRFIDGAVMKPESLNLLKNRMIEFWPLFAEQPINEADLESLRTPKQIADFIVLSRVKPPWMKRVDEILKKDGYPFTVDQVVDIARRPGLALMLELAEYAIHLDLHDDAAYQNFEASIEAGRARKSLARLRGVFGGNFQFLPESVRSSLIVYRPFLFPRPVRSPEIPNLKVVQSIASRYLVQGFGAQDNKIVPMAEADTEGVALSDYRKSEVSTVVAAIQEGAKIAAAVGTSSAGKTEILIWNLERALSQLGHRVVSLDAMKMGQLLPAGEMEPLLSAINESLQPTVMIFDESAYFTRHRDEINRFAKRFLAREGQHIVFVGGGIVSPEAQHEKIAELMSPIWNLYTRIIPVSLYPKPMNLTQTYRFLGLGRVDWMTEAQKIEYVQYVASKIPLIFSILMNVRLHEHPEVTTMEQAKALVDSEVTPEFWREMGWIVEEASVKRPAVEITAIEGDSITPLTAPVVTTEPMGDDMKSKAQVGSGGTDEDNLLMMGALAMKAPDMHMEAREVNSGSLFNIVGVPQQQPVFQIVGAVSADSSSSSSSPDAQPPTSGVRNNLFYVVGHSPQGIFSAHAPLTMMIRR